MANVDAAFGYKPVRHMAGGVIRQNAYSLADGYSTSLFTGDPVVLTGTGRNIQIATAGSSALVVGVFCGCQYVTAAGEVVFGRYWPASTDVQGDIITYVWDDPNILFIGQASGSVVAADIGLLADMASGTGSTLTGTSGWEIGASTGSENQLQLLELWPAGSNAYGANAVVAFLFAKHHFRALTEV